MKTIRDVAQAAGVSQSTVSRALNGSGYVSEATRQKVLRAAKELGFQPNFIARSLVSKATHTLGLILPDITNPFFPALARGVQDTAAKAGYTVIMVNTDQDAATEQSLVSVLKQRQVDGLILSATNSELDQDLPMVFVDRVPPGVRADAVVVDNGGGVTQATQHLLDLGHRRLAGIMGPPGASGEDRHEGFLNTLAQAGLIPVGVEISDYTFEGGYKAAQRLLNQQPSAIVAGNDLMAIGAIKAAKEAGLKVPEDIAIVGYDDIAFAAMFSPPLTTVAQPIYELGSLAAELLLERLRTPDAEPKQITLQPRLVIRGSCGAHLQPRR